MATSKLKLINSKFDVNSFTKLVKKAAEEAKSIYHYGHVPILATDPNSCESPACELVKQANVAIEYIAMLESMPAAVLKIIAEHEGYAVIPAIKEYLTGVDAGLISLTDSVNLLHKEIKAGCGCDACTSGITLSQLGIDGVSSGTPVGSLKELIESAPGSQVCSIGGYKPTIYTKTLDGKWSTSKKEPSTLNNKEFVSSILAKKLQWKKHVIPAEGAINIPQETSDTETMPAWFIEGAKVDFNTIDLAPTGAQMQSKKTYHKFFKKTNGLLGTYSYPGVDYTVEHLAMYGWTWMEPKGGSECSKLKKEMVEAFKKAKEAAESSTKGPKTPTKDNADLVKSFEDELDSELEDELDSELEEAENKAKLKSIVEAIPEFKYNLTIDDGMWKKMNYVDYSSGKFK